MTEVNGIVSPIMNSLFQFLCNKHNIINFLEIFLGNRKTVKYGMETGRIYTLDIKSLSPFKSNVKVCKCGFCQCRLCKK